MPLTPANPRTKLPAKPSDATGPGDNGNPASRQFLRQIAWSVALVALAAALTASIFLVRKHFGATLPGCGPQSGCESLERSPFSRLRLFGVLWPLSFLGAAYFSAMLAAWLVSFRRVGLTLGVLATVALIDSFVYLGVMLFLRTFCLFCLITHAANLVFTIAAWSTIWFDSRKERLSMSRSSFPTFAHRIFSGLTRPAPVAFFALFVAASSALAIRNAHHQEQLALAAEAERQRSVDQIMNAGAANTGGHEGGGHDVAGESGSVVPAPLVEQPPDRWGAEGFTGRYRKGPETAAIRIVVITDFQCPDCKRVEAEINDAIKSRTDASLSIKHFPMCKDCNPNVPQTIHGNACFAARAAEAAGILGGDTAYFKFVDWLFEVDGKFETAQILAKGVERAGLPVGVDAFAPLMQSDETLKRVQADVADAMALGLYYTPMVFINGVEVKGWQTPGAVRRTIEQVAAAKPEPKTAKADRPVLAAQRFVDDWKEQPVRPMQDDFPAWPTGAAADYKPADPAKDPALVDIIVFGDYTEPSTGKFDAQLREAMKDRPNVRYTFRHYPLNTECNPALPANMNKQLIRPSSCLASLAVEAAAKVGAGPGVETKPAIAAYWKMHDWIMTHQSAVTEEEVKKAAATQGLDPAAFAAALKSPDVATAVREDALAGQLSGLTSLPTVFVNGKQVPRPLRENDNIIKRIIEEAGKSKK